MSGPKCSRYTLTAAQRRILAAQTLLRQERSALHTLLSGLNEHAAFLQTHLHRLAENPLPEVEQAIREAQALMTQAVPATEAELNDLNTRTSAHRRQAVKLAATLRKQRADMEKQVAESIRADVAQGFSGTLDDALIRRAPSAKDYEVRLQTVAETAASADTAEKARAALAQLASLTNPGLLKSFADLTVLPLEKQCARENEQYAQEAAAWEELLVRRAALCDALGIAEAAPAWRPGALAELETSVSDMHQRVLAREEERFIRKTLDEVMVEMGYTLLGERDVHKRSGARFHHALYTTGDGTAIDVTYDANGQIAMELGGLDEVDRVPEPQEATALCEDMEDFCTSFADFEERLAARGVVLRERISHLPPDESHAQIINVQDYQLTGEPALYEVGRTAAARGARTVKYLKKKV